MKRFIITGCAAVAIAIAVSQPAHAQILYGYSTPPSVTSYLDSTNSSGGGSSYTPNSPQYYPWGLGSGYTQGMSGGGGGYSPVTVYPQMYPPMGSNYNLSPVRNYSSSMYGMNGNYGGMYSGYGGM